MSTPLVVGFIILFILAAVNGANDVGKSIAGIVETREDESNPHPFRKAIVWGGVFSGVGCLGALVVSGRLFLVFTQNLVRLPLDSYFALAVLAGAATVVVVGTVFHLPISSTHALVGAVLFELLHLYGFASIQWDTLILRVLLPMAASPFAALLLTFIGDKLARRASVVTKTVESGRAGIAQWASAAAISIARGLNDAPKIAAMGFFLLPVDSQPMLWVPYSVVAGAMVIGSIGWGRYVTKTLVEMRGELDSNKRLRAGLTTAALVSVGAVLGAPLSTTHVGAGAEAGVRMEKRDVFLTTTGGIVLGWAVTFPLAGIITVLVSSFLLFH